MSHDLEGLRPSRPSLSSRNGRTLLNGFVNRVAAITGAGSGVGRALAIELAGEGCHLALSDIDKVGLDETAEMTQWAGARVTAHAIDVADRVEVDEWARQVVGEHGSVHLLVNNAGVTLGGPVEATSCDELKSLSAVVDFSGVVYGTKAFVPHLEAAGEGHIVNVSSMFGLLGIPSLSAYNAAQRAVRRATQSLRLELDLERRGVSCTTIHLGGLKTTVAADGQLAKGVEALGQDYAKVVPVSDRALLTSPERAARVIVRAVATNRRRAMVGADAHVLNVLAHLPPGIYQRLVGLGTRRSWGPRSGAQTM